ncbi:MAG: amidohydrolase [Candidatus Neomarinimicrobiota bacterium]|nr:amidohydrolase [Candidatus Neomarinimicrobiota bacterium]
MKFLIKFILAISPLFAVDLIFFGGHIITMHEEDPLNEAVAIHYGKISSIGKKDEIMKLRTWKTKVVDLRGRTLMPGFIEAHCHPIATAILSQVVDISGFNYNSRSEILNTIRVAVKKASPGEWILAFGWDPVLVPDLHKPTLSELDSISNDTPIFILTQMMHHAFVNSAVYKAAGITIDTPNPTGGGVFQKDNQGNLNGIIYEFSALQYILDKMPKTPQGTAELLLNLQYTKYAKAGYTSISVLGPVNIAGNPLQFMEHLSNNGSPVRSYVYPIKNQLDGSTYSNGYGNHFFKIKGVKLYMDGSPYTGGAAFSEPYLNTDLTLNRIGLKKNHRGSINFTEDSLLTTLTYYHTNNYQIAIHAQGEVAIQGILDAFTKILYKYPRSNHRHRIEHNALITKEQIAQAKKLGLTLSFFIDHIYYYGDQLEYIVGSKRAERFMPIQSAISAGHHSTIHTDNPATPVDPFRAISTAVTRKTKNDKFILGKDERISAYDALKAITINAAWQLFEEQNRGSITIGKSADLVILSHNPLETKNKEIKNINVISTWIDGKQVSHSPYTWKNLKLILLILFNYINASIKEWIMK